ncbi:hypothetical protein PSPO01_09539 [Paraphaeosphaeria sporulosa]
MVCPLTLWPQPWYPIRAQQLSATLGLLAPPLSRTSYLLHKPNSPRSLTSSHPHLRNTGADLTPDIRFVQPGELTDRTADSSPHPCVYHAHRGRYFRCPGVLASGAGRSSRWREHGLSMMSAALQGTRGPHLSFPMARTRYGCGERV